MKINYDPEVDALYIEFRAVRAVKNIDIEEGISVDIDKDGHMVGLEILDATDKLKEDLWGFEFSQLPLQKAKVKIGS